MPNEFVIKNGYISQGNSLVNAILSANTITLLTNPTYNSSNTQILTRNSSTGIIEFITGTTGGVSSDNFVTGGTYSNGVLTLNRQNGSVIITGFTIDTACNFDTTSTYGLEYKKISTISGLTQGSYLIKSYITSFSGISKYGFWERTLGIVTTGGTPIITETTSDFDSYSSNFLPLQIIYTPTVNNSVEIYLSGLTSENLNWTSSYEIAGCGGNTASSNTNNIQTNDLFSYQFLLMGA